jgi:hypothetical protein
MREIVNWGDKSSSANKYQNVESLLDNQPRTHGFVDENGNTGTQRKNYGWANASRPLNLLLQNAYTEENPGLFGIRWSCLFYFCFFLERARSASPVAIRGKTVNVIVNDEPVPSLVSSPPSVVPVSSFTVSTTSGAKVDVENYYGRAQTHVYGALGAQEPPVFETGGKKV